MARVRIPHKSTHAHWSHDAANQPISPVMITQMNATNSKIPTFNFCSSSLHVLQLNQKWFTMLPDQ